MAPAKIRKAGESRSCSKLSNLRTQWPGLCDQDLEADWLSLRDLGTWNLAPVLAAPLFISSTKRGPALGSDAGKLSS